MLYLRETDVERLLDMPTTLDVVEEAFRQLHVGQVENSPRRRVRAPGIVLHSMSAAAAYLGLVGWKQYTTTRGGAKFHVGLYDQATGELIALIEADRLGQMRTGAVTGVAAKYLAGDTREVGLFGCGWQAESQLSAVAAACPVERALVYSRDANRRREFAARMSKALGLEVIAVDQPRRAAEGLPLVITATTSTKPVLEGSWLGEGALVCAIGSNWPQKAEVDASTVARAKVVCDSVTCCQVEAGELLQAAGAGLFAWERAVELADVVAGAATARESSDGLILFKSVGMALEDVAVGGKLLDLYKAEKQGAPDPSV